MHSRLAFRLAVSFVLLATTAAAQAPTAYLAQRVVPEEWAATYVNTPWPSMNFEVGTINSGISVSSTSTGAGGSVTIHVAHDGLGGWYSGGGIDVYVKGAPGTPFRLDWSCTGAATATNNSTGEPISSDVFFQGCDSPGPGGQARPGESFSHSSADHGTVEGVTSAKIGSHPEHPGVVFSRAFTFIHNVGAGSGFPGPHTVYIAQVSADYNLSVIVRTNGNVVDEDGDHVVDDVDDCLGTPAGETVDEEGCSASQRDSDGDGVDDDRDACPDTVGRSPRGCPPLNVRFDADRDGVVEFGNDDQASEETPFRFWLNNDVDDFDVADGVVADLDPQVRVGDAQDPGIRNVRDLEDFAQVAIKLPADVDLADQEWSIEASFEPADDGPVLNLYKASAPDSAYLTSIEAAQNQLLKSFEAPAIPVGGTAVSLERSLFDPDFLVAHLLFEGVSARCGSLHIRLLRSDEEVSTGDGHLCLHDIKAFYEHWTVGDDNSLAVRSLRKIPVIDAIPPPPATATGDYVLFVHGWRMKPWERRAFAETAYKRLWHQGFRGRFGLFSWSTGWVPALKLSDSRTYSRLFQRYWQESYPTSEHVAWLSAKGLHELLSKFWADPDITSVNLLAHSMGNILASEALRLEGDGGVSRKLVATYVATQAATPASAYYIGPNDEYARYPVTGLPYFANIRLAADKIVNFANEADFALVAWRFNNENKANGDFGCKSAPKRDSDPLQTYRRDKRLLRFGPDTYEIFSYCAGSARDDGDLIPKPLGAKTGIEFLGGVIDATVDLRQTFDYGFAPTDHSAQFMREIQTRGSYWKVLLRFMELPSN